MHNLWWAHAALHGVCGCRWISTGMLAIDLAVWVLGCFELLTLAVRLADTAAVLVSPVIAVFILDAIHAFATVWKVVVSTKARAPSRATAWSLVMACQSVATCKAPSTFIACMRPFSGVEFGVAFEVVETAEARLAGLTDVWLLLTVGEQVALEVVVSSKVGGTVWTLVAFVGGG